VKLRSFLKFEVPRNIVVDFPAANPEIGISAEVLEAFCKILWSKAQISIELHDEIAVVASERVNAQYQAAVSQFLVNMGNTQLKGVMDRQRIWHDAQQQISATIIATYQHQQAVQDRLAEQWSQTIRGVETYVNPSTGTNVELTGGYDSAWVNNRGEYLLSDSPGFNPAVAFQEGWTQLKKAK